MSPAVWFPRRARRPPAEDQVKEEVKERASEPRPDHVTRPMPSPQPRPVHFNPSLGSDLQEMPEIPAPPGELKPEPPRLSLMDRARVWLDRLRGKVPQTTTPDDAEKVRKALERARRITMNPTLATTSRGRLAYSLALDVLAMGARHAAAIKLLEQAMPALIAARDVDERADSVNLLKLRKALNG